MTDQPNSAQSKLFRWSELWRSVPFFLREDFRRYIRWLSVIGSVYFYFLVPPFVVGKIVDRFLSTDSATPSEYYLWVLGLGLASVAVSLVRLEAKRNLGGLAIEAGYRARVEGFELLLQRSLAWHDTQASGAKLQRIRAGSQALKDFIELFFQALLPIIVSCVGVACAFALLEWPFALFALAYIAFFTCLLRYFSRIIQAAHMQSNLSQERAGGAAVETASNIFVVKALGVEDSLQGYVVGAEQRVRDNQLRIRDLGTRQWQCLQLFNATSLVLLFVLIGQPSMRAKLSAGAVLVLFMYFMKLVDAASEFGNLYYRVIELKTLVGRMMSLYAGTEGFTKFGTKDFPSDWQKFQLRSAGFAYRTERESFQLMDISVALSRGQKVGFAGRSGSGKSTAAKIFLGLYELTQGNVQIDDTDIQELKVGELLRHVAYVPQESELFGFSFRENITMTRDVTSERLTKALRVAGLTELVAALPEGIETQLGEHGYRLSGGERQRLALARALCKQPDILILDEATSSLDEETERQVLEALMREYSNLSLILIAHRFSNLRLADYVYVFEAGRIVEEGTYQRLSSGTDTLFSKLHAEGAH